MNLMSRHRLSRLGGRDMGLTSRPGLVSRPGHYSGHCLDIIHGHCS